MLLKWVVLEMKLLEFSGASPFLFSTRASPWSHWKGGDYTTPEPSPEMDLAMPIVFGNCLNLWRSSIYFNHWNILLINKFRPSVKDGIVKEDQ